MKKIAVFFDQPNFDDYPFDSLDYKKAYEELAEIIQQKGGVLIVTRGEKSYLGAMRFKNGWQWDGAKFSATGEFVADVIYDKRGASNFTPRFRLEPDARILNPNPIVEICDDKFKTFHLFREFCPHALLTLDHKQLKENLGKIGGKKKVAKPLAESGSKGVVIGDDATILAEVKNFPVLVQEFIDISAGAPGRLPAEGIHDFRMFSVNGEIVHATLRTPRSGSLLAGALDGHVDDVPLENIPKSARELAAKIDAKFASYPRAYAIDVGFENSEPKIIELNSQPGLHSSEWGPGFVNFQNKLADALLNFI
ncbi:MAG: ATP-grasp domain-containing protein [Patescibacteria group bacterium]